MGNYSEKNMKQHIRMKNEKSLGAGLIVLILCLSLTVSLISLILYMKETDYTDEKLFLLLSVLRYSSFFVCFFSFFLMIACIIRIFRRPSILPFLWIFLSIFTTLYGAAMILLETAVISFTGGNG